MNGSHYLVKIKSDNVLFLNRQYQVGQDILLHSKD